MGRTRTRTSAAALAAGALTVVLAGCWPAPGQGPDRLSANPFETRITVDSAPSLAEDWATDLGAGPTGAPIASPSGVHAESGTVLHTLDVATGAGRWELDPALPVPGQMSDPVWQDGEVFVGYGYGNLGGNWQARSLDAATGEPARTLGGGLVDSLRGAHLVQSSVGFGSGGPVVVFLAVQGDLDDPSTRWQGVMDVGALPDNVTRIPATAGQRGVYHSGVSLLEPDPPESGNGVRMYSYEEPANCSPGSTPFVPCPTWATPLDGTSATSPVLGPDEETLYVATNAGTVFAVDAATGAVEWTAAAGAPVNAAPALAGGHLFVPTADGDLVVLAAGGCGAATCAPLWTADGGDDLPVQPAAANGVVFTGAADGSVRAFAAAGCGSATCPALWSAATGSRITGAPAVSGGRLLVGTQDGRVVAYTPDVG